MAEVICEKISYGSTVAVRTRLDAADAFLCTLQGRSADHIPPYCTQTEIQLITSNDHRNDIYLTLRPFSEQQGLIIIRLPEMSD